MTVTAKNQNVSFQGYNREFKQYLGFEKKFGYLNEFRKLASSNMYVVRISVPLGNSNHPDAMYYEYFDLYVKPADALVAFIEHKESIADDDVKVTVRFSCNNLRTKAWIVQTGKRVGQADCCFGGNLTYLHTMKVDGQVVHGYRAVDNTVEHGVDPETGEVLSAKVVGNAKGVEAASVDAKQEGLASQLKEVPPVEAHENELHEGPSEPRIDKAARTPSKSNSKGSPRPKGESAKR